MVGSTDGLYGGGFDLGDGGRARSTGGCMRHFSSLFITKCDVSFVAIKEFKQGSRWQDNKDIQLEGDEPRFAVGE